jgi:predicted transcriptional regulator
MALKKREIAKIEALRARKYSNNKIAKAICRSHTAVNNYFKRAGAPAKPARAKYSAELMRGFCRHLEALQTKASMRYAVSLTGAHRSWKVKNKPSLCQLRRRAKPLLSCVVPRSWVLREPGDLKVRVEWAKSLKNKGADWWSDMIHLDNVSLQFTADANKSRAINGSCRLFWKTKGAPTPRGTKQLPTNTGQRLKVTVAYWPKRDLMMVRRAAGGSFDAREAKRMYGDLLRRCRASDRARGIATKNRKYRLFEDNWRVR